MIKRFLLLLAIFLGGMEAGWGQNIVTDVLGLKEAITKAYAGEVITIAAGTYGSENAIESFGVVRAANVTIKAATDVKPKLYGTIQLMEEGCTVEGLAFYTKGGVHPIKNAIDVVAMSATIKGNEFNLLKPETGYVGNGVCIWPFGDPSSTSYTISGNTFKAFDASTPNWSSTALSIVEGCELSRFEGKNSTDVSKTAVVIPDELSLWTGNTFVNCYTDYVRSSWTYEENANAVKKAPVYSFTCVSSNADALKTAVNYSKDQAKIHIKGSYAFDSKLVIARSILLTGTPGSQATLSATGSFSDNLVSVENTKEVAIENMKITGSPKYGLHVFNSTDVTITGTTLSANKWGGMLVNGSTVTAANIITENNTLGGIEVGKGGGVKSTPKLTLKENCQIRETAVRIWADTNPENDKDVADWVDAGTGWSMQVEQLEGVDRKQTFWTNMRTQIKLTLPTSTVVEAGQPLSLSILSGGKAVNGSENVPGSFVWADANMVVREGTYDYPVIFIPTNMAKYEIVTETISMTAQKYFTVIAGVSANGKAIVSNRLASDRYVRGTVLNFAITPEVGYEFNGWDSEGTDKAESYKVEADKSFIATFKKQEFTVTITTPVNGTVLVMNDGTATKVTSGSKCPYGTVLTVTATPEADYSAESITSTGSILSKGQILLNANTLISATFAAKPESPKKVDVEIAGGGAVRLTDKATGKEIVIGGYVKDGTVIIIERTPNMGYKLNGVAREELIVSKDETIKSVFEKESYSITKVDVPGCTITVNETSGNYGDLIKVNYVAGAGYKVIALMVNAKEIPNNSEFVLTENTTIKASVIEKAVIQIDIKEQSTIYNGNKQAFVMKASPAGLDGFMVSYSPGEATAPINAGSYIVTITRAEDDNFKAYTGTSTLKITQAPILITGRPASDNDLNAGKANVAGIWTAGVKPENAVDPMTKSLRASDVVGVFTPTDPNYSAGYCALGGSLDMAVTTTQPQGGYITVWDGNLQIAGTGNNALKNTELRAVATPAEGYKFSTWTTGATGSNPSTTVTPTADITFAATFIAKTELAQPTLSSNTAIYDGTAKGGGLTITSGGVTTGWSYTFLQDGRTVTPVNAGVYNVVIVRSADADYQACTATSIFTITQATPIVTTAPTASVVKGAMLYSATVSGGVASTDGIFTWKSTNEIVSGNATKVMIFTPSDVVNYKSNDAINVSVTTTDLQVISFIQPENGVVEVKRGEVILASGDPIAKDDKLTITVKPNSGYELATLQVAGSSFANGGTYTVPADVTVNVVTTINKASGGGGTETVDVTGVSLNATTEALAIGAEFTLVATVTPTGATNKGVTWASSDPAIASVDANGKVKALKAGTCKITVTTDDGAYTASCDVTVSVPTGIDEILANSRIYTRNGAICIDPAHPVEVVIISMTGVVVYRDQLTDSRQISVSAGTYLVRLSEGKQIATVKVFVR